MNRGLQDITKLSIYSNEDWQQMALFLNRNLPVQKQLISKKLLQSYMPSLLFITLLLLTSLQLNTAMLFSGMLGDITVPPLQITSATLLPIPLNNA
ncbi:MAG: hypothetical protein H7320_04525 [Ferruginibacter sp.]|nr:hypothetical protein [Ferruginibacter sp.]